MNKGRSEVAAGMHPKTLSAAGEGDQRSVRQPAQCIRSLLASAWIDANANMTETDDRPRGAQTVGMMGT